jgi:hypothetical protein
LAFLFLSDSVFVIPSGLLGGKPKSMSIRATQGLASKLANLGKSAFFCSM